MTAHPAIAALEKAILDWRDTAFQSWDEGIVWPEVASAIRAALKAAAHRAAQVAGEKAHFLLDAEIDAIVGEMLGEAPQ